MRNYLAQHYKGLAICFLYSIIVLGAIDEFRHATNLSGEIVFTLSVFWRAFLYFLIFIIPLTWTAFLLLTLNNHNFFNFIMTKTNKLVGLGAGKQQRWSFLRILLALVVLGCSFFIVSFSDFRYYFKTPFLRMALLLPPIFLNAYINQSPRNLSLFSRFLIWCMGSFAFMWIAIRLTYVTNYPFSLSWSEGSFFWMYSVFTKNGLSNINTDYVSSAFTGIIALNSLPYLLFRDTLLIQRFWIIFLFILPAYLTTRVIRSPINNPLFRTFFILFGFLFLLMNEMYPPILISAMCVFGVRNRSLFVRMICVIVAGLLAAFSRWTWILAPAYWSVLIELLWHYPRYKGGFFRKLIPAMSLTIAGILPAVILLATTGIIQNSVPTLSQEPLLWYRLFPNATLQEGLLLRSLKIYGWPILGLFFIYMTKNWRLSGLQILAIFSGFFATLLAGFLVSIKIGGGDNLHNFDMFTITLIFLLGTALSQFNFDQKTKPLGKWLKPLVLLVIIYTCWLSAASAGTPLTLYKRSVAQAQLRLQEIQTATQNAARLGDVLFISQRQLLSYGFINDVPLIPEYDKLELMEHAMGNDATYFNAFHTDIKNHRFSMIVIDPIHLPLQIQGRDSQFGEENDAWVTFVSKPLVEEYIIYKDYFPYFNIWLMIPKSSE